MNQSYRGCATDILVCITALRHFICCAPPLFWGVLVPVILYQIQLNMVQLAMMQKAVQQFSVSMSLDTATQNAR